MNVSLNPCALSFTSEASSILQIGSLRLSVREGEVAAFCQAGHYQFDYLFLSWTSRTEVESARMTQSTWLKVIEATTSIHQESFVEVHWVEYSLTPEGGELLVAAYELIGRVGRIGHIPPE